MSMPSYRDYLSFGRDKIAEEDYSSCLGEAFRRLETVCTCRFEADVETVEALFDEAEHVYLGMLCGEGRVESEKLGDYAVGYRDNGFGSISPSAYARLVRSGHICRAADRYGFLNSGGDH